MKLILSLGLLVTTSVFASSQLERTIYVKGQCKKDVIPDRGSIHITVKTVNKDLKIATAETSKKYNSFLARVKQMKLRNVELATSAMSIHRQTKWSKSSQVFVGYRVESSLSIKTSQIEKLAEVFKLASDMKIDNVGALNMYLSEKLSKSTQEDCIDVAVQDAKRKANRIAKAANVKIQKILSISEPGIVRSPVMPMARMEKSMMAMSADSAPSVDIEKGKVGYHLSLQIVYGIQ